MDGEFFVEESLGVEKGIGGGNVLIQGRTAEATLDAARQGVAAIAPLPGAITPFPGGVARSGSKVGSRYKGLKASTADAFCPTLRGRVESKLHPEANHCLKIVIDGIDEAAVTRSMAAAIRAAVGPEIVAISAGNYGGKLGKFHFHLRELLEAESRPEAGSAATPTLTESANDPARQNQQ
jgi:formylmethanofuran--tetrahydromethanopterin N-formyltransferase